MHEQQTCTSNVAVCNNYDVTQSVKITNTKQPNYEHHQQYLNIINQHTNDKINSLIHEFNLQHIDDTKERRLYRQAIFKDNEDVLYELCKYDSYIIIHV